MNRQPDSPLAHWITTLRTRYLRPRPTKSLTPEQQLERKHAQKRMEQNLKHRLANQPEEREPLS